jgi:hypothetical protein
VETYQDNFRKLNAMALDVGDSGHLHWVTDGCRYLAQRLRDMDIPVDLVTHGGENDEHILRERMEKFMFPFFSKNLIIK